MRSLGNTLTWVGLMVGLPSILYAMTMEPKVDKSRQFPHNPERCGVCRHYRESGNVPGLIRDKDIIMISTDHPYGIDGTAYVSE